MEEVEATAEKRMRLMDDAWARRTEDCADELRERLEAMRELQKQMIQKAQTLHGSLAEELKDMRRRGVGRSVQLHLGDICRERGQRPLSGCWWKNEASRRTIESAGRYTTTTLVDITF